VSALNEGTRVQASIPMHARLKLDVGSEIQGQPA
jgi:hypothetical protein